MIRSLRKNIKNQNGFTLVELMVVIAILGILATIGITKLSDSTASANGVKIVADLRTIDGMISAVQASGRTVKSGDITDQNNPDLYTALGSNPPKPPTSGKYMTKNQAAILVDTKITAYTVVADGSDFKAAYGTQKLSDLN